MKPVQSAIFCANLILIASTLVLGPVARAEIDKVVIKTPSPWIYTASDLKRDFELTKARAEEYSDKYMLVGQGREHHFDQDRFSLEARLGRKLTADSTINRGLVDYLSASRQHLTQLDFEKLRRAVKETAFTIIPIFPEFAFDIPQDLTINRATHTRDRLARLWATRAK